jgi:hypothetical protein
MTRMKAETLAFERNASKDGFTYWAEASENGWAVFRRGKKIEKEAV